MTNEQLTEVAKILGVSEDSITAMDDEIKNSMTAVFEQVAVILSIILDTILKKLKAEPE